MGQILLSIIHCNLITCKINDTMCSHVLLVESI